MHQNVLNIILSFIILPLYLSSQCDPITPTFSVDLTGNPSGIWVSPSIVRDGTCCDQPARCIKIVVTLDPLAAGITFAVASGANPGGALAYEVNCIGPPTPSGGPICLPGGHTYTLTFCKVGNNQNTYQLTSIPGPVAGTDATINDGCSKQLNATGFNPATVTWNSIFPGAPGAYNNYLSCTSGCVSPTATAVGSPPPYVDYVVCGQPAAQCNFATVCDTVRVMFNPTLFVNIVPINPTICFGQTSTTLTANGIGGTPPYSYLWNNVNPSQTINVGVGTFNVQLTDGSGCPPVFNQVTVTAFSVSITSNAGPDQTKCNQIPLTTLNGTVTGASGGIWSGGTGTYSPNNTTLSNLSYSPTAAELASGSVNLILTTTGNGTCPLKRDTVKITYVGFTGVVTPSVTNVSCFGGTNGTGTMNLSGGFTPYTYLWNTAPTQSTSTASNLPIGTYSVTIRDGLGCTYPTTINITQPPILSINSITENVSCSGASTGSISATPVGGTAPYSYTWSPGGLTTSSITGLPAGNYSLTVKDANNCIRTATYTITQPLPIAITFTRTNVSCFNGSDGTVNSTITGGTIPYSFSWTPNGSTSQNVTGLQAGTYTLTVTDNLSCITTRTIAITQPTLLVASTTVVNETCDYLNNGSATASQTGGTAGYTYLWQPGGQLSASITNQTSGTYTVTITDSKGCPATAVATITEPTPLLVNFINQINVSCFGGSNASIGASPSGGTPNYTYSWTPGGSSGPSISNIPIGTYTVKVIDNQSCVATNTVIITQPTDIVTTSTITNVSCSGGSNGTIALTPSGGVSPYTYLWSVGGQTTSSVTGLPIGNYSVTVRDSNNCIKNYNYTITQPLPIVIVFTQTNVSCFNGSNGIATSTVTGGTLGYTYSWTPGGAVTQSVTGLQAGTYTLTVTDILNCIATNTLTITQPPLLIASTTVVDETCNYLNNGSATASQIGGTAGYTYSWQPAGQTSASITNQASGTYTVIVTDSKGCTSSTVAIINEPTPLTVSFVNQINVSCFGGNDGSIGASPAGGTPNYTYSWAPGGSTNATLSNIPIGTYTVTVTDNHSCLITNTVVIIQPTDIITTSTITNVSCNGGSNGTIAVTPTGGTSPYTYLWSIGGQTTSSVTGLPVGSYSVIVTDAHNCQKNYVYTVTQPLPIIITFSQTNVSCFNGANGTANSTVTGGTVPYTYSWALGGSITQNVTGLIAGTYTLTVTDNLSCVASNTLAITQPTLLVASTTVVNETCNYLNNGSASVSQIGGTAGYTYSWQPAGQTSASITNQASGTYTAIVTDSKGCISTAVAVITEPTPLVVNFIDQVNVSCFGGNDGSIGASPSGGTPNYSYSWAPGGASTGAIFIISAGIYSVTITDNNSCVVQNTVAITQPTAGLNVSTSSIPTTCNGGSNGSASALATGGTATYTYSWMPGSVSGQNFPNISSGIYTVTATDIKGCITTNTVFVNQPAPILPVTTSTNSTCGNANGIGSVSATGGLGPYTYSWQPTGGTNALAPGLLSGAYTVIVTDVNGCTGSQFLNVNDSGGPIASIFSVTNVSCNGGTDGSATAGVIGGAAPLTILWSPSGGNGLTASGLSAGTYIISIIDSNGCQSLATTSPDITEPPLITASFLTTNVNCFAGANGSATITASGGTPGYSYSWLPSLTTGTVVTGLNSGTYSVEITDANSCLQTFTYAITQPTAALSASAVSTSVSCFGGSNGTTSVTATGGTSPYNYNWMPGNLSGSSISNLIAGTYTATITDIKNCTTTTTVTVIQPTPIVLSTGSVNSDCGAANGQASVSATGGVGGYTYSWTPNGGTNPTANSLLTGTYSIQVADANSCPASATQTVGDNPGPVVTVSSTTSVSCNGGNNATATASVTGGTGPFTYTWMPSGGNGATATGLPAGSYTVFITAGNGCLANAVSPTITQPTQVFASITTSNVSCFAGSNGSATVTPGGGNPGYTFSWLPGPTTGSVVTGLNSGNYSVQVTDITNCMQTFTYAITQPTAALAASATASAVSCFGGSNGTATVNVSGGTNPYNYNWLPMSVNSQTIGSLSAGVYTVNVTDFKNCTTSTTVMLTQPTQSLSASANSVPTSCSGGSDGTATVTATGGTGSYSYSWSPSGGSGQTASGLTPGNYFINVTDVNSCLTNVTVIISSPTPVTGSLTSINPACGFANGSISSQVSGGIGPYTYTWSPGSVSTSTINGLLPGIYTLNASDSFGCIKTLTTTLINIPGTTLSLVSTLNDSCFGGNNGSATINISQGTLPYSTNWSPSGGNDTTASQLTAGVYTANVIDGRGCLSSITATITQPAPVSISINTIVNVSCFNGHNGSITVTASGGTPSYTYSWSPAGTGQTIDSLTVGSYTVNVKDSHYCPSAISMNVSQPTILSSTISSVSNPICFNGTGNTSVTAAGGTAPYSYTWTTIPPQNGSTAMNIGSGSYTVFITDANGCTDSNKVTLTQPTQIITNTGLNDTICLTLSGAVTATATGGAGGYYYNWQPLGVTNSGTLNINPAIATTNYTVIAYDQNGCAGIADTVRAVVYSLTAANINAIGVTPICPGQGTTIYAETTGVTGPLNYSWNNGLGTGPGAFVIIPTQPTTYIVTITNSCGGTIIDSVRVLFNPPPTMGVTSSGTLICVPGSLTFNDNSISGNINDPITNWSWSFGDGTSSNIQNPSHIFTTPGTYSVNVTVTTNGGCTNNNSSAPIIIKGYPYPVAAFSVNSNFLNLPYDFLICTNQSTGAAYYNWNFGDGGTSTLTNPTHNYTSVDNFQIQLIATTLFGCSDTAYADIVTDAQVVFPNAFTPNLDGSTGGYYTPTDLNNDIFFPYTKGVIDYKFQIFNRWGELIFETEDIKQGWDGYYREKICQVGVYIWKAYVKLNNGKVFNLTGDVTLLK